MESGRQRGRLQALEAAGLAVVAVAVGFRLYALGRLPGINGDEAWYGVLAARLGHANPDGWRTPSGNLPGPFQLGVLAILGRLPGWGAPPPFALLRVPSVLASLAQIALMFLVARKHFGRAVAAVAALLTAALPIEIAYARFGWDPSHAGMVAIVALHLALEGRRAPTIACFALAVWVHPTSLFLAPALIAADVFRRPDWPQAARRASLALLVMGAAFVVLLALRSRGLPAGMGATVFLLRLVDPRQWARFALLFVRLLSGETVYTYITGAGYGAARAPIDLAVGALLVAALWRGGRRLRGKPRELGIVVGWLASVAAFFAIAGPEALEPHVERYALPLMVPTILALAILACEALPELRAVALTVAISAALLVGFPRRYFAELEATGSTSHPTFWTGPVEPKLAAFTQIAAEARVRGGPAEIVAYGWWLTWPLKYLALGSSVEVVDGTPPDGALPAAGAYLVSFAGNDGDGWARRFGPVVLRWQIRGAGGHVAVNVWQRAAAAP
jgi:hypothetical protein